LRDGQDELGESRKVQVNESTKRSLPKTQSDPAAAAAKIFSGHQHQQQRRQAEWPSA